MSFCRSVDLDPLRFNQRLKQNVCICNVMYVKICLHDSYALVHVCCKIYAYRCIYCIHVQLGKPSHGFYNSTKHKCCYIPSMNRIGTLVGQPLCYCWVSSHVGWEGLDASSKAPPEAGVDVRTARCAEVPWRCSSVSWWA